MFTDASLNLRYNNTDKQHRHDLTVMARSGAQVCGLQEVQTPEARASVRRWLEHHPNWDIINGGECPILFRKDWAAAAYHECILAHPGRAHVNPQRVINSVIFHTHDNIVIDYFNFHAEQQFTRRYSETLNYDYRVVVARQCFETLAKSVALFNPCVIRIGGDFNVNLLSRERSWYPYKLNDDFHFDTLAGLDHIGYRIGHGASLRNPRHIAVNSDHPLCLIDVSIHN